MVKIVNLYFVVHEVTKGRREEERKRIMGRHRAKKEEATPGSIVGKGFVGVWRKMKML
jgi:hypothetical protein